MTSIQARKQRKALYQAPLHKKRKWMASHLEESLLLKYDRRSISVVKGDTVKVMRGSYKGHEDKVANVKVKKRILEIEGLTMAKADGNKIPRPIHPSNVLITKLNLTDKWRRNMLERGVSEETKKAIEQEAKEQIKEQEEEERRRAAEEKKREEEAKKAEEEEELADLEEEPRETPPEKKEPSKTPEQSKTPAKKPETTKAEGTKQPPLKKETPEKKPKPATKKPAKTQPSPSAKKKTTSTKKPTKQKEETS